MKFGNGSVLKFKCSCFSYFQGEEKEFKLKTRENEANVACSHENEVREKENKNVVSSTERCSTENILAADDAVYRHAVESETVAELEGFFALERKRTELNETIDPELKCRDITREEAKVHKNLSFIMSSYMHNRIPLDTF